MNSGKIHSIPVGSLVRDTSQGDIGLIVGPLVEFATMARGYRCKTQLVLWPSNRGEPMPMDLEAVESGWIEVVSEAR